MNMNKKIRLYDVTIKNGHGERHEIVPGNSKSYLIPKFETCHESVPQIEFKGWAEVNVLFSSREDYFFEMTCKNTTVSFSNPDEYGFKFLQDQFQQEIKNSDLPDDL